MKPIYPSHADANRASFFSRRHQDASFMREARVAYENRAESRMIQVWDEIKEGEAKGKFVSRKISRT